MANDTQVGALRSDVSIPFGAVRTAFAFGLLCVLSVALSPACSRKDDGNRPAGIPAMAPDPTAVPAPAAAPPVALAPPPAPEAAHAPEPADAPVDPKLAISGTVVLPASRRGDVSANDVVFLVARRLADSPQARGVLVAVKRLSAASFPIPFTLSARDMMIPGGVFGGEVSLAVRVDKDGDPMTRRKGDVFGGLPKVTVGARGVTITLDQVQKEDESLAGAGPTGGPMTGGPMTGHGGLPAGHP